MKERIIQIMNAENLTPSVFADKLQIGRAIISHILNDRNKPSLELITRILSTMDYINADWLLSGKGNMYKDNYKSKSVSDPFSRDSLSHYAPNLFDDNVKSVNDLQHKDQYRKESTLNLTVEDSKKSNTETIIYNNKSERRISKIIVYYTDNTFETFNRDNG